MQIENQAQKPTNYLKILKVDLIIQTVLAFLGIFIPFGLYFWSFSFSDEILQTMNVSFESSPRGEIQTLAALILFFSGIIGMFWQIISYFWQRKLRETWDKKTVLIRTITKFYYLFLILNFTLERISLFLIFTNLNLLFIGDLFSKIFIVTFLFSPIFWLIYYTNLWRQFRNLESIKPKII